MDAPKGARTRPTSDRVREALFSILFDVEGWRVLDLFAGTGAVGLEALSRGAEAAVFVEKDRAALRVLEKNLQIAEGVTIHAGLAARILPKLEGPFDLIFADPPWDQAEDLLHPLIPGILPLLTPDGLLVVEHRAGDAAPVHPQLNQVDARRYGDTALAFQKRSS